MSNREELIKKAASLKWFHAIDFGDVCSVGRYPPDRRQNTSLFPVFELLKDVHLKDAECMDVGAASGLLSFGMLTKGARSVTAVDIVNFPSLTVAAELLGLNVDYYPNVGADELQAVFTGRSFDLIVCAGVLYHMFNPMAALAQARLLLRNGGVFIAESFYMPGEKKPVMTFNPAAAEPHREAYTYWLISESALAGMLRFVGFRVLRTAKLRSPPRIAFFCEAVDYDQIENRTPMTIRAHQIGIGEIRFRPDKFPKDKAKVQFERGLPNRNISASTYVTDFPHHVDFVKNGIGQSIYSPKQADF